MNDHDDGCWIMALFAIGLCLIIALGLIGPCQESKTYNRLTGASTTWWDACWVELRVQGTTN